MSKKNFNLIKAILHFNIRIPFILYKLNHLSDEEFYPYYLKIANELLRVLKVNIKIEGLENLRDINKNYFVVSNHRGMIDPVIISKIFTDKRPLSYIMKSSLSNVPIIKDVGKRTNSRYLERNVKDDLKTILEIIELQKSGNNYLIFSEGTRNKTDANTLEFKAASFKIPQKAKSDIVYIGLFGTEKIFEEKCGKGFINVYLKIFKVFKYEDFKSLKTVEIAEKIRNDIDNYIEILKKDI